MDGDIPMGRLKVLGSKAKEFSFVVTGSEEQGTTKDLGYRMPFRKVFGKAGRMQRTERPHTRLSRLEGPAGIQSSDWSVAEAVKL